MHHAHATNSAPALREQLSALMDGECSSQEAAELSQALAHSSDWQQTWQDFEAVGSALRAHAQAEHVAPLVVPSVFLKGVMARVQAETQTNVMDSRVAAIEPRTAANDAVFRWKLVASVATMAAVLSVAWQTGGVAPSDAQMAAAPAPQSPLAAAAPAWQQVPTHQGTMLRDAELEALMAAHRQHGGMTALQMPAGFLRTATFDPSER